jgi:hypothetical protein
MKKLLLITMLSMGTLMFANNTYEHNNLEKKAFYDLVKHRLDQKKITVKEAQKMWLEYIKCCK